MYFLSNFYFRVIVVNVVLAFTSFFSFAAELDQFDPLNQSSQMVKLDKSVLIDIHKYGTKTIAVGEKGGIIWSENDGSTWQQADVPVSVTLTGVSFVSELKGWAVGHSGVVLHTDDGGLSWVLQLDGMAISKLVSQAGDMLIETGDPLLDVLFLDEQKGFVIGAFGLVLKTVDGGKTWLTWHDKLPNPDGNHLYAIEAIDGKLVIVGERGALFISENWGEQFTAIESPYEGSYFGLTQTGDNQFIIYGLRGHVYHTNDFGETWTTVDIKTGNAWTAASYLGDEKVVLVNQGGEIAISLDGGKTFRFSTEKFPPLTSVSRLNNNSVFMAGMQGVNIYKLP